MKTSVPRWLITLFAFGVAGVIVAFCIFTTSDKQYRTYRESDIPFLYQINENTDSTYFAGIQEGALSWNKVPGSYFAFQYDGITTASSVGQDDVNLVYFDDGEGGNFDEGTNTIAFSLTFTSNSGGFHSTESDLVWNSREFPPGTNGESNRIDLQSTITHEFGHHMGIAHFTEFGSPPGCGEEYPDATMAGGVGVGDTTGRSLHDQDIAASIELYPEWMLSLTVTDDSTGNIVPYAKIQFDSTVGYTTGDPESIAGGWSVYNCPGYIITDSVLTDRFGDQAITMRDSGFIVYIDAFGYDADTLQVTFNSADAIPGTELLHFDVQLEQQEWQQVTVSLHDSTTQDSTHGMVEFYALEDPAPEPTAIVDLDSLYQKNVALPGGYYDVFISGEYPYAATWFDSVNIDQSTLDFRFNLTPAQMLVVAGDRSSKSSKIYASLFDSLGYEYYFWDASIMGDSLPPTDQFSRFKQPMKLFVISEFENGDFLDDTWHDYLMANIDSIGNVMLAGNKIVGSLFQTELLNDKLGMEYVGATSKVRLKSAADDAITDKWEWVVLSDDATNQVVLDTIAGYPNTVSLDYESDGGPGLVYHQTENLKVVVVPFSIYKMIKFSSIMLSNVEFLERINTWMESETPTSIAKNNQNNLPASFTVRPNYPNPFNPSTTITWTLPKSSDVTVRIFNIRGQNILTKSLGEYKPGEYHWVWRGINDNNVQVASGVYWLQVTTPYATKTQKMMLLR